MYIPEWIKKEKLWKRYVIHKQYDFIRIIVDNLKENVYNISTIEKR